VQVSGSVDKTVRVWWDYETQASQPITYSLHKHQAPIFYVRFDDYGITSAARDTELIEWDFYTPSLEDMRSTRRSLLCPT
jgi:WD40 repeat protein